MRKRLLPFLLFVSVMISCTKQENNHFLNKIDIDEITFITPRSFGDDDTKTDYDNQSTRFLWAASDTVGIITSNGSQIFFPIEPSFVGTQTATFDGRGWALLDTVTYMAYYPFIEDFHLDYKNVPVSYIGQRQSINGGYDDIGEYAFWVAKGIVPNNGKFNFTFEDVGTIMRVDMPAFIGTYDSLTVWIDQSSQKQFTLEGTVDISSEPTITPTFQSKEITIIDKDIIITADGSPLQNVIMIAPIALNNVQIHMKAFRKDGTQVLSSFSGRDFTTRGYKYVNKSQVSVFPADVDISSDGGGIEIKVLRRESTSQTISLESQNTWITASDSGTVKGDITTYHFEVGKNEANTPRLGSIIVHDNTNNVDNTVTITQGKAGYIVGVSNWEEENHSGKAN